MKHWLETDEASAFEKEAETAKKIQEVMLPIILWKVNNTGQKRHELGLFLDNKNLKYV